MWESAAEGWIDGLISAKASGEDRDVFEEVGGQLSKPRDVRWGLWSTGGMGDWTRGAWAVTRPTRLGYAEVAARVCSVKDLRSLVRCRECNGAGVCGVHECE